MRIALVHYAAPPVIGGVERVLEQQAAILIEKGHQVVVVCANKGAKVTGAIMEYAPNFYVKRLQSALAGCEVVIVHNMFTMPFNWDATQTIAGLSREMTGARWINWVHDVDVTSEAFVALQLNARHVTVSKVRQQEFCAFAKIKPAQCRVVPNGLDLASTLGLGSKVTAFAKKHELATRELVLFHPTRVLARKNIELGLEVTAALRKSGVDAAYVVTGAPDPHREESAAYAATLDALLAKKKLQEGVCFAGKEFECSEADVCSLYALSDALFFPSKKEGFGLPLLEAKLHRLPVFCSDIPIHREIMGSMAHYFDLQAKPTEIAANLWQQMLKDNSRKQRLNVIGHFSWERIYQDYLEPLLKEH
jgi:mannosylglucosylglycerate synthase